MRGIVSIISYLDKLRERRCNLPFWPKTFVGEGEGEGCKLYWWSKSTIVDVTRLPAVVRANRNLL